MFTVPMKNLKDHDFENAFFTKEGKGYVLLRRNEKHFLVEANDWIESLDKTFKRFNILKTIFEEE